MTTENHLFISLDEIKGLRFECNQCHAKVTLPVTTVSLSSIPPVCVGCGAPWLQGQHDERHRAVSVLLSRIADLRGMQLPIALTLEIANPFFGDRASSGKD